MLDIYMCVCVFVCVRVGVGMYMGVCVCACVCESVWVCSMRKCIHKRGLMLKPVKNQSRHPDQISFIVRRVKRPWPRL